ncbi:MAG: ABC transporter substrate-binding protein [Anaeromyxobacter sp.]
MRAPVLLALLGAALACSRPAPPLPPVRLFAGPGLPGAVVREGAARAGLAAVTLVDSPAQAELVWVADPVQALALGERLVPGSAAAPAGVDHRWLDPQARFAPGPARARVLVVAPRAALPFQPVNARDLADPRLAGRVVLAHPARGDGPVTLAALALRYGDRSADRFLQLLAANRPQVVETDAEARAAVARGRAALGWTSSLEGAAGAASAAGLEVVYPDQAGAGAVVLPTAVALLSGAGPDASLLAGWLTSPAAEQLLVARAPGLLPLRPEVPVPVGVEPAGNLRWLRLDWDRLAETTRRLQPDLERWPDAFTQGPGLSGARPRP